MFKKFLIILTITVFSASCVFASNSEMVRSGISKYKAKNYAGCICTMKDVIKNDPSNVMAHYYTAISFARLGDKTEATNYYNKVVSLNSNATLTSYAKQGLEAINNGSQYNTQQAQADKFVQAGYKSGVNPDVTKQLKLMELERKKDEINSQVHAPKVNTSTTSDKTKNTNTTTDTNKKSMSGQPTDEEIAQAVKTLAAVGINPLQLNTNNVNNLNNANNMTNNKIDAKTMQQYQQSQAELAQLQMMLGSQNNNPYNNNNNMMNYLPYLMQQGNSNNPAMSKEFIQTMMMTQMMPNFSFDTSKN